MFKLANLTLLVGVIGMLGCRNGDEQALDEDSISIVLQGNGFPEQYSDIAWIDDWLFVGFDPTVAQYGEQLLRVNLDGEVMETLVLPETTCEANGFSALSRLPDNRLSYISRCPLPSYYLMAYDPVSGTSEKLLNYSLPDKNLGTGGMAQGWNPEMTQAITSQGTRALEESFYWLTPENRDWQPLNLPFGNMFGATWSPDGTSIAFVAAGDPGTVHGPESVYHLYLMDADGTNIRPLIDQSLGAIANAIWSPDSQWLAFSGFASKGSITNTRGIWLINFETRNLTLLTEGNYYAIVWSPDGQKLAAIQQHGESIEARTDVVVFDLYKIISSSSDD